MISDLPTEIFPIVRDSLCGTSLLKNHLSISYFQKLKEEDEEGARCWRNFLSARGD
jgi:hypothetical protein